MVETTTWSNPDGLKYDNILYSLVAIFLSNINLKFLKMKKIILFTISFLFFLSKVTAQTSTNAAGGDATGAGGSVAYSVGQPFYITNSGANGSVAQGVQQTYQIFSLGINQSELNISLAVFPNPTYDNLNIEIKEFNNENLSYELFDIQSKLLASGLITSKQTQINLINLPPSAYVIHISQKNKKIQSFKIIKN